VDSTAVISFDHRSAEEVFNHSLLNFFPAQEWGFAGSLRKNGLPGYAMDYQNNQMNAKDPLYGNIVAGWLNPRYTNIFIDKTGNFIDQTPKFSYQKDMYSRFDWYRGDYNYGIFGAVLSGIINDEYSYSIYGEDFRYAGNYNAYTADKSNPDKSVTLNFALDVKKERDQDIVEAGFNYKRLNTGNIAFSEDFIQEPNYDGYSKKFQKQIYLKYTRPDDKGKFSIGGQLSNFDYSYFPVREKDAIKGQGATNSLIFQQNRYFSNDTLLMDLKIQNKGVFLDTIKDYTRGTVILKMGSRGQHFGLNYHGAVGFKSSNFLYSGTLEKRMGSFALGFHSGYDHFEYPYIYQLLPAISDYPDDIDDFQSFVENGIFTSYTNKFIFVNSSLDYTQSNFYQPYQNSVSDTVFSFRKCQLKDLFWHTKLKIVLPWRTEFFTKISYSPTVEQSRFHHLQIFGSMAQKISLFKGNLNLYAQGSFTYVDGGQDLYWFDEFQTLGLMDHNYYTNERLCFSARFGFRVASLHMFYQIHNIENRSFSNTQGMLLQNSMSFMGVEWYFFN